MKRVIVILLILLMAGGGFMLWSKNNTSAIILSQIGTVNTVWFAFVITEVLVAALAILLMKLVYSRTIQSIPTEGTKISNHFAESVT